MNRRGILSASKIVVLVSGILIFIFGVLPLLVVLSYHLSPGSVMHEGTESYIFMFIVYVVVFIAMILLWIQLGRMAKRV